VALRLAIDANRYIDFCRNDPDALRVVQSAEQILMPFVVLAELRAGFLLGSRNRQNEKVLGSFLHSSRAAVLFPDDATTQFYASLFVELRKARTPIPANDLWIAALALQHDLVLFSRDSHFDRIPRIPRV
jgi:tRNA(fMet)-specific endonuclease VapC